MLRPLNDTGAAWPLPGAAEPEFAGEDLACRRGERLVFVGVSFRVLSGGALLLRGANGSGKSSLLRLAAGLLRPAAGRFLWAAAEFAADPSGHHRRLHYVGHLDGLKPAMTARENLTFTAALRGLRMPRQAPALDDAIAAFGLETIADWPCRWLSAGQRRRVALARLLAAPAPLWLLDEPTTALDDDGQDRLARAIAAHRAAGGMAIIATHAPIGLEAAATLSLDAHGADFDYDPVAPGE